MARVKKGPMLFLISIGIIGFLAIINFAANQGWLGNIFQGSIELKKTVTISVDDDEAQGGNSRAVAKIAFPSREPARLTTPRARVQILPWNAQMGFLYAVGGQRTMKGSIAEQKKVNVIVERLDDYSQMQNNLFEFAQALANGDQNPAVGTHFVGIMGDGGPAFLQGLNPRLKKLGDDYQAVVVGSFGYSRGEDKMMGPAKWRDDAQLAKGGVCAGVLRDGDWNIAIKWLADNGIRNNPNEKTYDPDALNWIGTSSFTEAGEKYITGYTEDRPVVKNGKNTGETKTISVDCVVTWTPGDVTIAQKKGGLVSVVSTKDYNGQMPHALIGIKKWVRGNREAVENLLDAAFEGADQINRYPDALNFAGEVSAQVYEEKTGPYWVKYAKGITEKDRTGIMVELGGSKMNNLSDTLYLYGLSEGGANIFGATYKTFGDYAVANYPDLMPSYPPVDEILDTSFIKALASRAPASQITEAEAPNFDGSVGVDRVISQRLWKINFVTNSADFTPDARRTLQELENGLLVAGNLAVEVHGHTDGDGDAVYNRDLSERRAVAVREFLYSQSSRNFPRDRFLVVGHGEDNPIASNDTVSGKSQNRRVEVKLGTAAR